MPQMAPISWLGLFMTFSLILIIFNCVNYYSFLPEVPETHLKGVSQTPLNWKW